MVQPHVKRASGNKRSRTLIRGSTKRLNWRAERAERAELEMTQN